MDSNVGTSLFQPGNLQIDNENLEEAEDLEEQKKRQEEIQSYLHKAMDDFNYDDQSTVNSSNNTSVDYQEPKYKDASLENQLEVLYNVRVREVESLTRQVQELQNKMETSNTSLNKTILLLKQEKDSLQISLKQSQELLVDKCEELSKLQKDKDNVLTLCEQLKQEVLDLKEECDSFRYTNNDLMEQLALVKKGFSTNPITEKQIEEHYQMELQKVQEKLQNALNKTERLENEQSGLNQKYHKALDERDTINVTKSGIINQLTDNLDQAQAQNRELLELIDGLSADNKKLKTALKERGVDENFRKDLSNKTEMINVMQREMNKMKSMQETQSTDYSQLQKEYADLIQTHKETLSKLKEYEMKSSLIDKSAQIALDASKLIHVDELKEIKESMEKEINSKNQQINELTQKLEENKSTIEILNKKIALSKEKDKLIDDLTQKAELFQKIIFDQQKTVADVATLTEPVLEINLKPEIDEEFVKTAVENALIQKEIALRTQLQEEYNKKLVTAMNKATTECANCLEYKAKVSSLQEKQTALLETVEKELKASDEHKKCDACEQLTTQLKLNNDITARLKIQLEQYKLNNQKDREAILKVLDEWQRRFELLESEKKELELYLKQCIVQNNDLQTKLALREKADNDLAEAIKNETEALIKQWNVDATESLMRQISNHKLVIDKSKEKMDLISLKTEQKIKDIQKKYSSAKSKVFIGDTLN